MGRSAALAGQSNRQRKDTVEPGPLLLTLKPSPNSQTIPIPALDHRRMASRQTVYSALVIVVLSCSLAVKQTDARLIESSERIRGGVE